MESALSSIQGSYTARYIEQQLSLVWISQFIYTQIINL